MEITDNRPTKLLNIRLILRHSVHSFHASVSKILFLAHVYLITGKLCMLINLIYLHMVVGYLHVQYYFVKVKSGVCFYVSLLFVIRKYYLYILFFVCLLWCHRLELNSFNSCLVTVSVKFKRYSLSCCCYLCC